VAFGSNDKFAQVSNIVFEVVISSPLLINNANVPDPVLGAVTSHLILSAVPSANCPDEPNVEVLFWFVPSDRVSNTIEADVSESAIIELVALV